MVACVAWRFGARKVMKASMRAETARRLGQEQLARAFAASPLSRAPDKTAMLCKLWWWWIGAGLPMKFQYLTLSTHRIRYVLMTRTVQTPTKLIRVNRATGILSFFSLFFSVCLFFRSCLFTGNPWRVNNGKVNNQVQALIKLETRLRSPDEGTATEKPWGRGFVSTVVWDLEKIGKNSTNVTSRMTTAI